MLKILIPNIVKALAKTCLWIGFLAGLILIGTCLYWTIKEWSSIIDKNPSKQNTKEQNTNTKEHSNIVNKVKTINLIFETGELVEFSSEEIIKIRLSNIVSRELLIYSNSSRKIMTSNEVYIKLHPSPDKRSQKLFEDDTNSVDRIVKYFDISAIEVIYEDGKSDYYYVPWSEKSNVVNFYQTNWATPDNYLEITIKKT